MNTHHFSKKFIWIYAIFTTVIVLGGVYFAFTYQHFPQTTPKIGFSHFKNPQEMGFNIYKRLKFEIEKGQMLLFGINLNSLNHPQIVKEILNELSVNKPQKTVLVIDSDLKDTISKDLFIANDNISIESFSFATETQRLLNGLKILSKQNTRVVFIGLNTYLSSQINGNLYSLIQSLNLKQEMLIFTLTQFPMNRSEESKMPIPCNTSPKDRDGSGPLGCTILIKSKSFYFKTKKPDLFSGSVDQIGLAEYLVLFNEIKNQ